jgi:signal transduction histidine kinase
MFGIWELLRSVEHVEIREARLYVAFGPTMLLAMALGIRDFFDRRLRKEHTQGALSLRESGQSPRPLADTARISSDVDPAKLKLAGEALSSLSRMLMDAQERERRQIAKELHDGVGQRMALLTIELERLGQELPDAAADARIRVNELCGRVTEVWSDVDALSRRLHSSALEYLGIEAAATSFCRELSSQQDVSVDFSSDGIPQRVPGDVALGLFRVLQEAVNNAAKHAGVRQFTVALRGSQSEIQLEVADMGIGFDPAAAIGRSGLGLISMQQRVSLLNGDLLISSRPGSGTRIRARVPVDTPSAHCQN